MEVLSWRTPQIPSFKPSLTSPTVFSSHRQTIVSSLGNRISWGTANIVSRNKRTELVKKQSSPYT